jgi:glutamyl/glutaminyl-tRNA synthetase
MGYKLPRIAPTPSGFLHLGNVFSFAITAAMARRSSAEILLRIDDLDRERVQREYVEDIFDTLRFMEIPWDRGPRGFEEFEREYSQVHRLPMYRAALERLREAGVVFACDCSRAEVLRASKDGGYPGMCRGKGLSLDAGEISWRLRTAAGAGDLPAEMRDFVVRKKDGFPAYQLSSVVDDLYYGVDLIVRGQDLWASTQAQLYLSYALDAAAFRDIRFYHHRLLVTGAGEKLSKSAGATSIRYLRQQGLTAGEIYALIAREAVGAGSAGDAADALAPGRAAAAAGVRDWAGLAALVLDL